jgi:hypothetical protein
MESKKSCLKYFERPVVADQISSRLADARGQGLELRLFQTFLLDPEDPFKIMNREYDLLAAARAGHFGAVKWLYKLLKRGPEISWVTESFQRICTSAASGGHLEIIRWARREGLPWDDFTPSEAAKGGHLECLKWLRENGCPLRPLVCSSAASGGHLEILQWACRNGTYMGSYTCANAALGGHLEVL